MSDAEKVSSKEKSLFLEGALSLDNLHPDNNFFERLEIVTQSGVYCIAGSILEAADAIGIDKGKRVRLILEEIK